MQGGHSSAEKAAGIRGIGEKILNPHIMIYTYFRRLPVIQCGQETGRGRFLYYN